MIPGAQSRLLSPALVGCGGSSTTRPRFAAADYGAGRTRTESCTTGQARAGCGAIDIVAPKPTFRCRSRPPLRAIRLRRIRVRINLQSFPGTRCVVIAPTAKRRSTP
jgi:hypothetical protein